MEATTQIINKTGNDFLKEMCSFEADFNALHTPRHNPITNRVEYIMHQLNALNVPFTTDIFDAYDVRKTDGKFNYININVFFKGANEGDTVVFLAHHDVHRMDSENAQDNTASVCNLLDLASQLKNKELKHNVLICFTDAEEIVDPMRCGAAKLALDINAGKYGNVLYAVNLELTGLGKNLWVTSYGNNPLMRKCMDLNATFKGTPYSDTYSLFLNGIINTVCIGILPDYDIDQQDGHKVRTWGLCHHTEDTFEKCSKEDMSDFVENVLMNLL